MLSIIFSHTSSELQVEIVKNGTYKRLFTNGGRIYTKPRKVKTTRGKARG